MPPSNRAAHNRPSAPRAYPLKRMRFWLVCLFFLLWAGAIGTRLFWLQVVRHQEFLARANHQSMRNYPVAPRRGILYDRKGNGLAMTVQADSVYADPSAIDDPQTVAHALAAILHTDPDDSETTEERILAKLKSDKNAVSIARRISPQKAEAIKALNRSTSISIIKEFKRFYPADHLAAQVLGFVGTDDNGMAGVESKFDALLHGTAGERSEAVDARHKAVGSTGKEPTAGRDLTLTIDSNIQFIVERALDQAMQRTEAESGTVVVEDVHTGEILALATRPTFNPNQVLHPASLPIANTAISNAYEPGSTFKLVTYSAVLDQQLARPDETIDCSGGQINVYGAIIRDDKSDRGMGRVSVDEALAHSSDVCAIKMALRLGPQRMNDYMRSFGFGGKSGIELPGETRGMLLPLKKWQPASIGYFAIGQGVAVTPIQLAAMVSTIANGGVYLAPHILGQGQLETPTGESRPSSLAPLKSGEELPNPLPQGAHRVISTLAAAQMRQMMEDVVIKGTGKKAQLNGYSSGGKTGTAQKIVNVTINGKVHSVYSKDQHIGSFAGFAPVNIPAIAVAVVMDSPHKGYYGSDVAAPVFTDVAQQVLDYIGVPHDMAMHPVRKDKDAPVSEDAGSHSDSGNLDAALNDLPDDDPLRAQPVQQPAAPQPTQPNTQLKATAQQAQPAAGGIVSKTVMTSEAKHVRVPQLTGLAVRKVIEQAGAVGLDVKIYGSGICHEQAPAAGTVVSPGSRVLVKCGR